VVYRRRHDCADGNDGVEFGVWCSERWSQRTSAILFNVVMTAMLNYEVTPYIEDQDHQRLLRRTIEEDTRILSVEYFRENGIPFLLESWNWEGVRGQTAVFLREYVSGLKNEALVQLLNGQTGLNLAVSDVTVASGEEHTFVNFGFETE
jgi:hypothetical protein